MFQGLGKIAKEFYNGIFKRVDRTIIPDYPQPNTICALNLNFEDESTSKVEYTGPLPARNYEDVIAQDLPRPHVLSLIGGFGYRAPIFRRIIEAASMDSTINYTLLSGPGLDREELPPLPDNAGLLPFIPDQFPYLKSCDLAIAPGGHTTMMEALAYGPYCHSLTGNTANSKITQRDLKLKDAESRWITRLQLLKYSKLSEKL